MCVRERERERANEHWSVHYSTIPAPLQWAFSQWGKEMTNTPLNSNFFLSFSFSIFLHLCVSPPIPFNFPNRHFSVKSSKHKAKWLYMLYSSCISECVTDVLLAVHEGFIGISIITRVCCNFSHLWDLFTILWLYIRVWMWYQIFMIYSICNEFTVYVKLNNKVNIVNKVTIVPCSVTGKHKNGSFPVCSKWLRIIWFSFQTSLQTSLTSQTL